jgi:hypothetical protein
MLKSTLTLQPNRIGEAAIAASRQVWLASLGAAVVTREWAQSEAGAAFRTLVKEGTAVESRTIRLVGDRLETSISMANTAWKETRRTVESTVKQAADAAVTFAQQVLPRSSGVRVADGTEAPQVVANREAGEARRQGREKERARAGPRRSSGNALASGPAIHRSRSSMPGSTAAGPSTAPEASAAVLAWNSLVPASGSH